MRNRTGNWVQPLEEFIFDRYAEIVENILVESILVN